MNGRIVYCKEMWFSSYNLVKITLYECSTDKENDVSYDELKKMLDDKVLVLHTPEKGRTLPMI